ncbi:hypothetical protein KUTeg_021038 [Tegillarca granosa]|uniref:Uncharacterized protein n=1 Tax=Tegillarca granosa TaxID=220873 RepID=A0ABQ9EDX2_TEGGR|nr:hypothetical protein KUTeg_021038 [Tegillarca granosa]
MARLGMCLYEMYPDVPEPDPDYEDEVDSSTNVKPSELHVETQDGKPVLIRERNPSVTSNPETNESELIKPKKLTNPCIESSTRMALHKELLLNYKRGIDILQKPELDKVAESGCFVVLVTQYLYYFDKHVTQSVLLYMAGIGNMNA